MDLALLTRQKLISFEQFISCLVILVNVLFLFTFSLTFFSFKICFKIFVHFFRGDGDVHPLAMSLHVSPGMVLADQKFPTVI